jgi:hypothetical protein
MAPGTVRSAAPNAMRKKFTRSGGADVCWINM